jgi:UDP:flavonoid glycosyltransferase YjiC (YdhE family)
VIKMRTFVLSTMFSAGDVLPFVRLGAALCRRGHRVTLVSHSAYQRFAEDSGVAYATWDSAAEHAAMMADGALFDDPAGFTTIYERYVVPMLAREADVLRELCDEQSVVIARCGPALAARAVAEERGATFVEAYLGPGHVSPLEIVKAFARPFRAAIAALRGRDDDPAAWVTACNARFGSWSPWFAAPEPHWPPGLELVGFGPEADAGDAALAPDLAAALAERRPHVLLACGTGRFLTPAVIAACARAVDHRGGTLLVVTPFDQLVAQPLPACVHHARWAPYAALIPRMDLVIHHGGIGTVVDALRAGVPQLVLGAGGDRPVNARCVERLGVGRYVPPAAWSDDTIASAVRDLLASEDVRDATARAAEQLRTDTGDACAFLEAVPLESFAAVCARAAAEARPHEVTSVPVDRARLDALTPAQRALLAKRLRKP